jgi:hypothetical protein
MRPNYIQEQKYMILYILVLFRVPFLSVEYFGSGNNVQRFFLTAVLKSTYFFSLYSFFA